MIEKIKYALGYSNTRPVFVIGTGRSGTHWLGYSLGNHPEVRATVEVWPIFDWSTQMALNPALESKLFGKLVRAYKRQLFRSAPRLYLDKTHPNIWLSEKLKRVFPQALFVGIYRNPYATVASMIRHEGVSAWHKRWREFPIPNRFLGITSEIAKTYEEIPLASKCALRWVAHHERMNELRDTLGPSLKIISYEDFAHDTDTVIQDLQHFLDLRNPIPTPNVTLDSLTKWKTNLSDEQIEQVHDIVGFPPDTFDGETVPQRQHHDVKHGR